MAAGTWLNDQEGRMTQAHMIQLGDQEEGCMI